MHLNNSKHKILHYKLAFLFAVCIFTLACSSNKEEDSLNRINCQQILRNHHNSLIQDFRNTLITTMESCIKDTFSGVDSSEVCVFYYNVNELHIAHEAFIYSITNTKHLDSFFYFTKEFESACNSYLLVSNKKETITFTRFMKGEITVNNTLHLVQKLGKFLKNILNNSCYLYGGCSFGVDVNYYQQNCYKEQTYSFALIGNEFLSAEIQSATCDGKPVKVKMDIYRKEHSTSLSLKPEKYGEIEVHILVKYIRYNEIDERMYPIVFKHINK